MRRRRGDGAAAPQPFINHLLRPAKIPLAFRRSPSDGADTNTAQGATHQEANVINKSASKIGTVEFKNGNQTTLWIGSNHNTGETILWQVMKEPLGLVGRSKRVTGKNLGKLATELNDCLNEGECKWIGERNDAALDGLKKYIAE